MTDPHHQQTDPHRRDPWSPPPAPAAPPHSAEDSTRQQAKDAAGDVAHDAQGAGRAVADTARDEAAGVKDDAVREGRKLWDETTSTLGTQASDQLNRAAGTLRTFSDDMGRMSRGEQPEDGLAKDLAGQVTDRTDSIAGWLEDHEPADVLTEVQSFARRRPVAFLAIAAGIGFAAGRLTRSVTQSHSDDNASEAAQPSHRALVDRPSPGTSAPHASGTQYAYSPTGEAPPPPRGGPTAPPTAPGAPVPGAPQPISPDAAPVTSVPPQPTAAPRTTDPYGQGRHR